MRSGGRGAGARERRVMLPEITSTEHETVRRHYERISDLLVKHFGGTPIAWVTFPKQLGIEPVFHKSLDDAPATIRTVPVRTSTGTHPYVALDAHNLTWLVAASSPSKSSVGLRRSTTRTAQRSLASSSHRKGRRPTSTRSRPPISREKPSLPKGLPRSRCWAASAGSRCGFPLALNRRTTCSRLGCAHLHPIWRNALSVAPHVAERGNRVMLGAKSNHPGMGSLLPYALRGTPSLEIALPVAWDDLGKVLNGESDRCNVPRVRQALRRRLRARTS